MEYFDGGAEVADPREGEPESQPGKKLYTIRPSTPSLRKIDIIHLLYVPAKCPFKKKKKKIFLCFHEIEGMYYSSKCYHGDVIQVQNPFPLLVVMQHTHTHKRPHFCIHSFLIFPYFRGDVPPLCCLGRPLDVLKNPKNARV